MSLILDALNRSRNDAEEVPGLSTQHPVNVVQSSPLRRYLPWAALAVALVLIAWLLFDRSVDDGPRETAPAVAEQPKTPDTIPPQPAPAATVNARESQPAPQPSNMAQQQGEPTVQPGATRPQPSSAASNAVAADRPAAEAPGSSSNDTANADAVSALYQQNAVGTAAPSSKPARPAQTTRPAPAARPQVQAPRPAPVAEAREKVIVTGDELAPPAVEEEPVDVEDMLRMAREGVKNTGLVDHPVPFMSDQSQQFKDSVPTLLYQKHDYSRSAATIVVNGKTLRAGANVSSGLRVEEILTDSAIFSYKGTKFRLRALNSWVNL